MTIEETHVHPTETALEQLVANHLSGQRSPALLKALLCDACLPHVIQALTELLPYAPFCRPNRSAERDTTLDHRYEEGERTLQTLIRKQQEPDTLNPEDKTTILSYLLDALHDGPDAAAVWIDLAGKYGVSQALPLAKIMLFTFIQPTYFTTFIRLLGATAESLPRLISQSRSRNPEEERALGQRLLQLSLQDPRLVTTCLCSAIRISPDWLRIASFVIDTWPENNAERVALCAAIGDRLVDLRKDLSRSETGISGLYASLQHREDSLTRVAQMSALSTDHGTVLILLALATPKDRIDTSLRALVRAFELSKLEQETGRQVAFQRKIATAARCLQERFGLTERLLLNYLDQQATNVLLALAYIVPSPAVQYPHRSWS